MYQAPRDMMGLSERLVRQQRGPPAGLTGDARKGWGVIRGRGGERGEVRKAGPALPSPFERTARIGPRLWLVRLCWSLVYLPYLGVVVNDLVRGDHTWRAAAFGWVGLAVFVASYLALILMPRPGGRAKRRHVVAFLLVFALSAGLTAVIGESGLVLLVYVSVCCGVLLPVRWAAFAVPTVTLSLIGIGLLTDVERETLAVLSLPAALGGMTMMGVGVTMRTMRELREARETIAHLAASDERLRLARDLHDLLGHSLSLVTLKSELARRLLPERPEDAAKQVNDIERVSRQALVDVRAAVSGFRRPRLVVEIAGARTALRAAQIDAYVDTSLLGQPTGLGPDEESALAWALREAVTNVVRHSGAGRCEVTLGEVREGSAHFVYLEVSDNGRGAPAGHAGSGNGLTGLEERLILSGGRLEIGPGARGKGFRLRALVPVRASVPAEVAE